MGKSGDLLRQKKMQTKITFTREQLIAHDEMIREQWSTEFKKRYAEEIEKTAKDREDKIVDFINKQYDEMNEFYYAKDESMRFLNWMQVFISVGVEAIDDIVKNKLKWKSEYRINKIKNWFLKSVTDQVNVLANDYDDDLKCYSERMYKKHGLAVAREEVQ